LVAIHLVAYRVDADQTGLASRSLLGRTRIPWGEVAGVDGDASQVVVAGKDQSKIRVDTTDSNPQVAPDVAMDAAGDFVVAWTSFVPYCYDTAGMVCPPYGDVYARRFNAAGRALGAEFRVNTTPVPNTTPAVAMEADGDFVVVWDNNSPAADGIYARRFDPAGLPLGTVDEIQRLQILGPPPAPGPDTFTLNFLLKLTQCLLKMRTYVHFNVRFTSV